MTSNDYELKIVEFETNRNDAMDDYFNARPHLERTRANERLFEAGFRMAWEMLIKKGSENDHRN